MEEPWLEQQYDDQSATDTALGAAMDNRKYHSEQTAQPARLSERNVILLLHLSKSIVKDKLDLSLMFLTPTDDKLNIKQKTVGSDYVQNMTVKVPLRQISLTLTWKFGNTKKQFQKVKSNIKNDFQEEKQGIQTGGMNSQQEDK